MKKICVVTGTSSGIGAALVPTLLEQGWEVFGIARREADVQHEAYTGVSLDLADLEAVQTYFDGGFLREVNLAGYGRIGMVNNAAALGTLGPQDTLSPGEMARVFNLNTIIPIWLMGFFLKHSQQCPLVIVNVSSGLATVPRAGLTTYCASKAALRIAGLVAAEDVENFEGYAGRAGNTAIVSYSPGTVATAMQENMRGNSTGTLPSVQRFVDLYEQKKLKPAEHPSREIAALLSRSDLPLHSEITFGYA